MQTVFGAELSLGGGDRTEDPDPPGPHLLVLARGPEGYRRLSRQLATAQSVTSADLVDGQWAAIASRK